MRYCKSPVNIGLKACLGLVLIALIGMSSARAAGSYGGVGYGQAKSDDVETENLFLLFGRYQDKGPGFEFFYAPTIDEDEISSGSLSADITLDTYGLLINYRTSTDDFGSYLKFGAGLAVVDLEFDFGDLGSLDDDTSGFAYGIGFGLRTGGGAVEINYLVLPEFDEFEGIEVDAETDIFSISYLWYLE